MDAKILLALRTIFGLGFLGTFVVQVILIIQVVADSLERGQLTRTPLLLMALLVILGLVCVQVVIVCVFQLLRRVAENRIFDRRTFRWVDTIAVTIGVAAVLVLPLGYIAAELDDAPGLIIVSFFLALLIAGLALLVYVQRTLLAQAVNRDVHARNLESELGGVI